VIVVLNGTSSAGKTTLARALQDALLPDVWLLLGIDWFIGAMPFGAFGTDQGHTINADGSIDLGTGWHEQQAHWRAGIVAIARSGADLILDEVFLRGGAEQAEWASLLDGLDGRWVGVHVDVDVAEARERARGDRSPGMARHQASIVHDGVAYDLEVDTTSTTPEVLAAELVERLRPS
jgi:chloramphenicol 3-O phosphotransferase